MAMGLFLALHCAGTLVILPRYQPDEVLAAVTRERIGVFLGSPTIFNGLLAHPGFAQTDWHTVHTCYSGSAALPAATLARWRDAVGAPVLRRLRPDRSRPGAQRSTRRGGAGQARHRWACRCR